jgi:hypothetical protein
MTQVLTATCINGHLILSEQLSPTLEGKTVQIIINEMPTAVVNEDEDEEVEVEVDRRFALFLEHAQQYAAKLPADYQFNREELYER